MADSGLGRAVRWIVVLASFGALCAIGLGAVWFTHYRVYAKWWVAAALAFAVGVVAWRLVGRSILRVWRSARLPKWVLPVGLFVVFFAVKVVFALHLETEQQSDFLMMYQGAQAINAGDFSFSDTAYWHFFAYQTPFTIYEAFMLKVSGGSLVPLLVAGAVFMAGTNLLVYLIGRKITGSAVAGLFAAVAYLVYPSAYLQASALTNDHLSAFLLYLGAYVALTGVGRLGAWSGSRGLLAGSGPDGLVAGAGSDGLVAGPGSDGLMAGRAGSDSRAAGRSRPWRDWRGWALAAAGGVLLALGNLARPAGLVVVAALVAALVLAPVMRRGARSSWRPVGLSALAAVVVVAAYGLVGAGADGAIKASGINPAGASNNLPEWKFVFGLQGNTAQGRQDLVDIGAYDPIPKPDARQIARAALERDIRQLPQTWHRVLARQVNSMWARNESARYLYWPQFGASDQYRLPDSRTYTLGHYLVLGERGVFLPIILMAAWGVVLLNRDRRWGALATFLACFVAGYALIHLAIEVQPRYRYLFMPAVFCLAAPAWACLTRLRGARDRR
ncbi:MAG: glycosyltransferase family 39 protein [Bifidobacteriaceae bacterium]|jgi:hypothetical protein|nr:glycosyltransferase family 39 protein [Bifidobacteriaceae bacterium]